MTLPAIRASLGRLNVMHQAAILAKHEEPARQQWLREDAAALREVEAVEKLADALRNLLRDSMASDFNNCWDSYKAAESALAALTEPKESKE